MPKFMLGILGLILIISVVLSGFSNLDVAPQDYGDESMNELEPTQHQPEPTEPMVATESKSESVSELTSPEPAVVVASPNVDTETRDIESTPEFSTEPEPMPEPIETDTTPFIPPVQKNYSEPVSKAMNYFMTSIEPEAILWLDVMHRRFGIDEFTNALEAFEQTLLLSPSQSYVNLFRRMADYSAQINSVEIGRVSNELDLITLPALYCDRLDLPANYSSLLIDGVSEGGYKLTHVLLAWIWLQENGGKVELPEGFVEGLYIANAALINTDSTITDLEMEAAAFLCLAGKNDLVDESFIDQIIATQESDGSWGGTSKPWHTTILGLLCLLHMEFPSNSYPSVLAPKPT